MTILEWEDVLSRLVEKMGVGELRILLMNARLSMPPTGDIKRDTLRCSAMMTIGGKDGLNIEAASQVNTALMVHTIAATQATKKNPFALRGVDADGSRWLVRDTRLESTCRADTGALLRLHPMFTSVSTTHFADRFADVIEIALPLNAALPDAVFDRNSATYQRDDKRGHFVSADLDIHHAVVGEIRVVTMRRIVGIPAWEQALRLVDALAFVNGCQISPRLIRRVEKRKAVLTIFRERPTWRTESLPPFEESSDVARREKWIAIEAYFRFCFGAPAGKRPLISQCVSQLQGAYGALFISNKALATAIAVESLVLKFVRSDVVTPWPRRKREKWKQWLDNAKLPNDVRDKHKGAIGNSGRNSTTALLRELSNREIIPMDWVKVWAKQRPRHAHGNHGSTPEEVSSHFTSVNIFHAIVLSIVGYAGQYQAHSYAGGSETATSHLQVPNTFRRSVR